MLFVSRQAWSHRHLTPSDNKVDQPTLRIHPSIAAHWARSMEYSVMIDTHFTVQLVEADVQAVCNKVSMVQSKPMPYRRHSQIDSWNAGEKKEGSENVKPAHCIIRRNFRAAQLRALYCEVTVHPKPVQDGDRQRPWFSNHALDNNTEIDNRKVVGCLKTSLHYYANGNLLFIWYELIARTVCVCHVRFTDKAAFLRLPRRKWLISARELAASAADPWAVDRVSGASALRPRTATWLCLFVPMGTSIDYVRYFWDCLSKRCQQEPISKVPLSSCPSATGSVSFETL
ncbi:hypothetical protein EVAR_46629_1 [Eumeta japonica]|uniref:Uncharacterized protein n=1 Tax=Eumeta variegata TaxID=151549 RepID=A0A4C1WIN4_EUMVA|nr:hypothetical protein EVAR_46629_1 [Eumeta japonica]